MKKFRYLIWVFFGLVVFLLGWGLIEPYVIDTEEEIATIPNLPEIWSGERVAQISDFQLGMWWDNDPTIRRIVDDLIEENPAAVLISGDFIYHATPNPEKEINRAVNLLRPLTKAGIPTYAVLGNHDYGMRQLNSQPKEDLAANLEAALAEIGVDVLQNEAILLPPPENTNQANSAPLYLVGVGAYLAENSQPEKALADLPETSPRIVMMHNPNSFAAFPANTAPLAIAGHTHGGQIRVPFTPEWSWVTLKREKLEHIDGWAEDYGASGNQLYVNRGIGFSDLPIRFNCPPEVTFFTLMSEEEVGS
ncbi:metallophosphoesterase [Oscillatoria salina]|uniref:metallophosphoesterase n=1 Tax=Oscillatoria salina TaxID=331517 RepID=UPI001CCE4299|nr:metallophosphoesterase [Oscillatoria salina]MBZ8181514.1 metallophosphoesterase [Oscillatoria salina IIICB1]